MQKIKRSWKLVKTSWHALMQNKQLLIFPIISLLIGFLQAWPPKHISYQSYQHATATLLFPYLPIHLLFLYYLLNIVLEYMRYSLFGAFAYCIFTFLEGQRPQLRTGIAAVLRHRTVIFIWVLLEIVIRSTLALPLVNLSLKGPDTAIAITGAVGMLVSFSVWFLATCFIMPVIIFENLNAISALKRSISILKGICKNSSILMLIMILCLSAISYRYETKPPVFILSILVNTTSFIVEILLLAFSWCYVAILYTYALTGMLPSEFPKKLIPEPRKGE